MFADWLQARARLATSTSWRPVAEALTWSYAAGGTAAITAVVERQAVRRVDHEDGEFQESRCVLRVSTAAVTPVVGDSVTIDGAVFVCSEIVEKDAAGGLWVIAVRRLAPIKRHAREFVAHE